MTSFRVFAQQSQSQPVRPTANEQKIDFHQDVAPLLNRRCAKCHSGEKPKGEFRIDTRQLFLAGGESGPAVVLGKSAESYLIELILSDDPEIVMPSEGRKLNTEEISILRVWIDQGLAWEQGFRFNSIQSAPLEPRRVKLPSAEPGSGLTNPIDLLLQPYYHKHNLHPGKVVSDRVFARRVYLDLIGLLPSPEAITDFEKDSRPEKRKRLVRQLLNNRKAYAEHWLTFWNDALRNAYRGTGYIDGGRKQITSWLYQSLYENKPYNQFVHELISPVPGSEGFIQGIIWRGVVNASQRREMQAAQNIGQIFMGTNLKCASCHDSFINQWKLTDSHGLAAVFTDQPLQIHRCNKPTGDIAEVRFIFPQLGSIDPQASKQQRMQQLADLITRPENGRLTRTMVNRLWAWLMGRGIVEPVDDLDQPPFSADVLDWLAVDFADHQYNLQHTLEIICTSRAYQLPALGVPSPEETGFVFQGPFVKRMTAEQFVDAVSLLTGVWPEKSVIQEITPSPDSKIGIRAALLNDDPLMRALGRPNREQVVTRRDTLSTTLQALELTNGRALDRFIARGAENWLKQFPRSSSKLIEQTYLQAIGRLPHQQEKATAMAILAQPMQKEGVADLLWVLTMLPEFQLIY